jgi:uncharacterized membrane protein YidH (DUF202 family)
MAEQRRHARGTKRRDHPHPARAAADLQPLPPRRRRPDREDHHVIIDNESLTWIAFGLLVIVAILGETMFLRWRHSRREATPEARFPVPVVYAHGLFALITVVLVLLTALAIGGS